MRSIQKTTFCGFIALLKKVLDFGGRPINSDLFYFKENGRGHRKEVGQVCQIHTIMDGAAHALTNNRQIFNMFSIIHVHRRKPATSSL